MQENDQSRRGGRPSLLTEKAPVGDSGSILSKLDGGKGAPRPGGGAGRVAGIAAAVALTGGAIGWVMSSADTPASTPLPVTTVASQPQGAAATSSGVGATVVSAPSAAKVVTVASPGSAGNGSDVSAAAILEETPAKHESGAKSLAASLEAPSPSPKPAAAGGKDELMALLDKPPVAPAGAKVVVEKPPAHEPKLAPEIEPKHEPVKLAKAETTPRKDKSAKEKTAAKDKARQKEKARTVAAAEKKRPAKAKQKAPIDSDAALLAALLTHTKKAPARKMTEYQRCSTRETVAAADKCRERLCASGKAPAECKPPRVAKAES